MTGRLAGKRTLLTDAVSPGVLSMSRRAIGRQDIGRLGLASLLLLAGTAAAEEQLTLPTPDGWQTQTQLVAPMVRRSEFAIPSGSGEQGRDKLSFEWFAHALAPGLDPLDLARQLASGVRAECEGSRDQPVFAGYENGYPTVVRLITCPRRKAAEISELLMLKAIQGDTGHWIIVRGRQAPAATDDAELASSETVREWSVAMRAMTLCDPDAGAAHPCPATDAAAPEAAAPGT